MEKYKKWLGNELDTQRKAKAWKTIWSAGQGVTAIEDSPSVKNLLSRLKKEFTQAIKRQMEISSKFSD